MFGERAEQDTRHQWVFMLMFELSSAQAARAQAELDRGKAPDPIALDGSLLDLPNVFCWRCLLPFDPDIDRNPCSGDDRRPVPRRGRSSRD